MGNKIIFIYFIFIIIFIQKCNLLKKLNSATSDWKYIFADFPKKVT